MSITSSIFEPITTPIARAVTGVGVGLSLDAQVRALFGTSQGVMYDLSDASSVFVDSAGTTAISAGQGMGRVLDKSGRGNHATQSTTASKAIWQPGYAGFDGVDDFLVTPSINFTGTDKMTVVAGVTKLSDAAAGMIAELSAATANPGMFMLVSHDVVGREWSSAARGSTPMTYSLGAWDATPAPDTAVIAITHDIAGDLSRLRRNGVVGNDGTGDKGTGNFGNYPLYIGRRGGVSVPFNGRIYRLLIIGRTLTAGELALAERWAAQPTGVTLA